MEYAIYTLAAVGLAAGLILNSQRKVRKRIDQRKHSFTVPVFMLGGDPRKDRIEFHYSERD